VWQEDPPLYRAAKCYFGSWREAASAAGHPSNRRCWTEQTVIEAIQARQREHQPLQNMGRHDPGLAFAASRMFGSWVNALQAAEVTIQPPRRWTATSVVAQIQHWHREGVPVSKIWEHDKPLVQAAYAVFGNWRTALAEAGLQSVRERWSKERIIRELREHGSISSTNVDRRLLAAAKAYFGGWQHALVAAGLLGKVTRRKCRSWSRDEIIATIRARHQQGTLTSTWREDRLLCAAAKRTFGSWREALEVAGFPQPSPWTSERVLQAIDARRARSLPLVGIDRIDPPLYRAAKRYFGGWHNALRAAGLKPKLEQRWSKHLVLQAIRLRGESGLPLSQVWREDTSLFGAAVRYFGSWEQAMRAAGMQPSPRKRWSRDRVIRELQHWQRHSTKSLRQADAKLAAAAARLFGSLDAAMEAAHVVPKGRRWSKLKIVETIQDLYVRRQPANIAGFGDIKLAAAAKRHFGSWSKALSAAGLTDVYRPPKPTRNWTKASVLEAIQAWDQQGRPLTDVSKQDQGLYCGAKQRFGSWRAALRAAGFESAKRVWNKRAIVNEIRDRRQQGQSLSSGLSPNTNLAAAAARHFGTWRKALRAAGVTCNRSESMRNQ
jgi:hypothetical protein